MESKKIHFLKVENYEHPWDRAARDALEQMPGFTAIIKKLNEVGFERLLRIQYTGSSLKVNGNNLPDVHEVLQEACNILAITHQPDLYLQWQHSINAFTAGVDKPILVLNSGCIDLLSQEELLFVIAHELGHIKSKHVLYYETASYLPALAHLIGSATLGIGSLLTTGLQLALLNWKRMSELTADRAGLLACQKPEVAATTMVKMAGLPQKYYDSNLVDEFIKQAKEFESYDYDTLDQLAKVISTMSQSHPWTVMRAAELFKWVDSGEYEKALHRGDWRSDFKPWQIDTEQKPQGSWGYN
jgi:Zn-dependent protease with chaperone function